jgi:hypothetical protein
MICDHPEPVEGRQAHRDLITLSLSKGDRLTIISTSRNSNPALSWLFLGRGMLAAC